MKLTKTKIILVIILFTATGKAYSNPVDVATARRVAQNFASKSRNVSKTVSSVVTEQFEGHNSFYVVNFGEGGWVMVSADNSTVPVFAFSDEGTYRTEDEKPPGLLYLLEDYKTQVDASRKTVTAGSKEVKEMWSQLMVDDDIGNSISRQSATSNTMAYTPGTLLLGDPHGGGVAWGQDINNDNGCNPAYNSEIKKKWNHGWFASCDCGSPPVGCGAVAIGQIMWYWQWPKSSKYRTYNWSLIPNALLNSTPSDKSKEVALLLLDCAEASNMTYACAGSFTTSLESALKNTFDYKFARTVKRSDLLFGAWNDLIRSEIDFKRPVIMYGAKAWTIDKRHYFIVDGCHATIPNYFHINFGWRGSFSSINHYYYLNNINPGSSYYSDNNYAIVDIFPTPVITGSSVICSGSPKTFSATNNWQSGYYWDKSNNLINLSSPATNSTVTVSAANIRASGATTVSIKNSAGVELASYNIWVGTPNVPYITGATTTIVNCIETYNCTPTLGAAYTWTGESGFQIQSSFSSSANIYFTVPGAKWVEVKASNTCGDNTNRINVQVNQCAKPPCIITIWGVYPNPASDILNIEIDTEAIAQAKALEQTVTDAKIIKTDQSYDLRLYDHQGNLLRQTATKGGTVQFNVANLPVGIYYLHIYDGVSDKPEIRQIVVER